MRWYKIDIMHETTIGEHDFDNGEGVVPAFVHTREGMQTVYHPIPENPTENDWVWCRDCGIISRNGEILATPEPKVTNPLLMDTEQAEAV